MEIFYATILGFLLLLVIYLFYNQKSGGNENLPPGKIGFPVIGETLEFLSTGWKGHPEKFVFDRMAKYSCVFKTSLFGSTAIVLSGLNGQRFLFSNENKLVQVWYPHSFDKIIERSGPQTTNSEEAFKGRYFLRDFLKPVALQGYISSMDRIAQRFFANHWEEKDMVVAFPLTKNYNFSVASHLLMSVEDPKLFAILENHLGVLAKGIVSVPIDLPGTPYNRAIKASNVIKKELLAIVRQRKIDLAEGRATPIQDVLSQMLLTSDDNGNFMAEADIANKILALSLGSYDSVSSVCASIVKYLAELPEVYQGVYQEQLEIAKSKAPGELLNWDDIKKMIYSWNVACEVMRLAPPVQGTFREALTNITYNGFSIPKGWKMYWSSYTTHRNHEFFPEPQKFDPSRFEGSGQAPYTYVPFGGGPRMCPGKGFARLEILVFMHHLVKRFRWEKLIPDEKIVYTPLATPEKGLPIRLFPHKS
ncbi:hypothetical protein Vadar_007206 [Vaccinium darrowii]|uniref:Uncharacterized protein n=1 Tax=Vaccinium darrowii TaxID=229202 RepID=A0ACB7XXT0_9ERIC|nr:hypothetical protein Vadar_007206 [Vaccinium darrowii]